MQSAQQVLCQHTGKPDTRGREDLRYAGVTKGILLGVGAVPLLIHPVQGFDVADGELEHEIRGGLAR